MTPLNVVTLSCAAQEQLEEDLAKEGEEGDLNLDQNLLNEYSKLKETAMARASKPTRDCATQEAQLRASARKHLAGCCEPCCIHDTRHISGVTLNACKQVVQQCCC